MDRFNPIHIHFMLKAAPMNTFTDPEMGKQMLLDLVKKISMVPVTEPQCVFVDYPGNEGLTGSINLATSHIAFHVWDEMPLLQIDVYSCCEFLPSDVMEVLTDYFGGFTAFTMQVMDRTNFRILEHQIKETRLEVAS